MVQIRYDERRNLEREAVSENYIEVHERLVWSRYKLHRARLVIAVTGLAAGIVIAVLANKTFDYVVGWGSIAICFPWAFYEIYWLMKPNTALVELLPQGIIMRTTTEDFIIPWSEIKSVETIDIHASFNGRAEFYPGVTAVLVSKHFYDRVIHVDTLFMRGPGWGAHFVPKGDEGMFVALHHSIIPASAEEIKRQVEARWKSFGKKPADLAEANNR